MDSSRRAVEAYWRSRMIDAATSDEDKVAPVYKLEEICEVLRSSDSSVVKEVSDYILKRLDHKSPIVKQKALRLIKYAVGKSGNEFRREMQRQSAVLREMFHYKGHPDPLKGDALNKAVRDNAHEAMSAVFASDDYKTAAPVESLNKRIQGFGNTNFEMATEDKKSFLSEVVGIGSASIRQGLSTFAVAHSIMKNENGSGTYKSPTLRRSLTTESDTHSKYELDEGHSESRTSSRVLKNVGFGTWTPDAGISKTDSAVNDDTGRSQSGLKSREERLLETIVTSGGVRLQPTRDALQVFLHDASKLDALAMSHALEIKLQSHLWPVRVKAICVLESILRKKDDDEHFSIIASYFSENRDSVVKCSELPQVSMREKATKVLHLLDGEQTSKAKNMVEPSDATAKRASSVQLPDLIDTVDLNGNGSETSTQKPNSIVDDLFSNDPIAELSTTESTDRSDPFADVSFHVAEDVGTTDLFSGLMVEDKSSNINNNTPSSNKSELFDIFGGNSEQPSLLSVTDNRNVNELMAGLALNQMPQGQSGNNEALNGVLGLDTLYSQVPVQSNLAPNFSFNPAFAAQQVNYGAAMGAFIAQQQLLLQNLGNLNSGYGNTSFNAMERGGYSSPLPDIFQVSNSPVQSHSSLMSSSRKEETKAFDFVLDHLAAARGSKKVL